MYDTLRQKPFYIFTNLLDFDDRLFQYVEDDVLYVMFKLDSFVTEKIKKLYGKQKIDVERLNKNIKKLVTLVKVENGCTNLCASIVPTALNYDELSDIISFCNDNNIFPLIGDLEDSGRGQDVYQQLKLSDKKLEKVKSLFRRGMKFQYVHLFCVEYIYCMMVQWPWMKVQDYHAIGFGLRNHVSIR